MAEDIRIANLAMQNFSLALAEFQVSCQYHQWQRAEDARLKAISELEASMDAFASANKRLELAGR